MIINQIPQTNNYIIKIIKDKIDIYNPIDIEKITNKIIKNIKNKNKLEKLIILEIYPIKKYGTIIILNSIKTKSQKTNETEVKITIHTNYPILYKIDYNLIKESKLTYQNIYYYQKNFYLKPKDNIPKKEYLYLLELSEITYQNTLNIINYGLKIKL